MQLFETRLLAIARDSRVRRRPRPRHLQSPQSMHDACLRAPRTDICTPVRKYDRKLLPLNSTPHADAWLKRYGISSSRKVLTAPHDALCDAETLLSTIWPGWRGWLCCLRRRFLHLSCHRHRQGRCCIPPLRCTAASLLLPLQRVVPCSRLRSLPAARPHCRAQRCGWPPAAAPQPKRARLGSRCQI